MVISYTCIIWLCSLPPKTGENTGTTTLYLCQVLQALRDLYVKLKHLLVDGSQEDRVSGGGTRVSVTVGRQVGMDYLRQSLHGSEDTERTSAIIVVSLEDRCASCGVFPITSLFGFLLT